MPVKTATVALTTAAAALLPASVAVEGQSIVIQADVAWFLGGSDVTTATGISIAASERVVIDVGPGDRPYGILASGTGTARVLRLRG